MKIAELKEQYKSICKEYVKKFCKKQDMCYEGWVGDVIGGIVCINDFYFNFSDIVLDIDTKQPKGFIIDWYYDNIEVDDTYINYSSYIMGLRVKDLNT
jgi:hypothetical protein